MKTQEWTYVDRSKWPDANNPLWASEPDKAQWIDEATGLPCLVVRGPSGALCGYVGVSVDHPYFEKGYDDVNARVHGGLTFADHCHPKEEFQGICHIVEDGDDDNVWWLGFDCAHAWDVCPRDESYACAESEYRDIGYVKSEVRNLARQLKEAS